jgi:tetratricopeptide (TPR) repeat protein
MKLNQPAAAMGILAIAITVAGSIYFGIRFLRPVQRPMDQPTVQRGAPPEAPRGAQSDPQSVAQKPRPAENRISKLQLSQDAEKNWAVRVDYVYSGEPPDMGIRVSQTDSTAASGEKSLGQPTGPKISVKAGTHSVLVPLSPPPDHKKRFTTSVAVQMVFGANPEVTHTAQVINQAVLWPSYWESVVERALAKDDPEIVVVEAVGWIDRGTREDILQAKALLEPLIQRRPQTHSAYVEMARVAMRLNWGPEGLHEAEGLLNSALQIHPESVNAKILLGYVYAHQTRFKQAEAMLLEASKVNSPNLWLWTNWGETLQLQGKSEAAIAKYRQAIAAPVSTGTYDRARRFAYDRVIGILEERKDYEGLEALYKRRAEEYQPQGCYGIDYALFVLRHRADFPKALSLVKATDGHPCNEAEVRDVLAIAHYAAWGAAPGAQRAESLNRARVYLAAGPKLFYRLASSEKLAEIAKQLIAAGERVDQQDNAKYTALAYAVRSREHATTRRLLHLGAKADHPVGEDQMPTALIPIMTRDFESIRLMQRAGVDYAKLRYQGTTAVEHAQKTGDAELLKLLKSKAGAV